MHSNTIISAFGVPVMKLKVKDTRFENGAVFSTTLKRFYKKQANNFDYLFVLML